MASFDLATATEISIHALRKESDWSKSQTARPSSLFQSTLSVRRATQALRHIEDGLVISIHALRKESDSVGERLRGQDLISIHALRKESDTLFIAFATHDKHFNPRSP